ncbi:hypothetical protein QR680_012948 [Steinernema hermaphroditum]|uniref:Polypeptide N-acetylgalactosaminyltransferase n=1 Tax=Steinernema hermaphroditum TaxID=289476 RepID=A0AA39M1F8_9BILA|nr:hypothetical protein QR680_012948 [Steinernema hermaphroditum]
MHPCFRVLLPRRKENVLNFLLALILFCLIAYLAFDQWTLSRFQLPPQEGITWPSDHVVPDFSQKRYGPGEEGRSVILTGSEKEEGDQDMKKWFMNVKASDKISLDRSIPDTRLPECAAIKYDFASLPKASVVIIFTDEAWSPLLRTVHSVFNRSPPDLLQEILLLDDFSHRDELWNGTLANHIKRFGGKVRLERLPKRHGLIRAKLAGAKRAKGQAIIFLDSHCEANEGWLPPLLQRIHDNRKAVICPVIDFISAETMSYSGDPNVGSVGGFWWSLHFRWDPIPEREKSRRKSNVEPINSPTMAGGLLAADREYFLEVGGYDEGMHIWGGENLELSFRVWMCGGSIEFIPCSHVGHIFRAGHPYDMTGPGGNKDVHGTNSKRLAEVWMGPYKRLYYLHRPDLITKDVGDLSERYTLRDQLKCKSFKWYLDNVIPEKFVPDENVTAYGAVRNPSSGLCLDTLQRDEKNNIDLGVFSCQGGGSSSQVFSLTKTNVLRREMGCARASDSLGNRKKMKITLGACTSSQEEFILDDNGNIKNKRTGLCLDSDNLKGEYCEYSGKPDKCRVWLEKNLPSMIEGIDVTKTGEETPEEEKKHQKRGGKGSKPEKEKSSKVEKKVTVQRAPRGKNKSVTVIKGLGTFDVNLKEAAKIFSKKFACSSSVTGADEIVVQGDVKDDLFDLIPEKWPEVDEDLIEDLGDQKR